MFAQFFGSYLIKRGKLTKEQFDDLLKKQKSTRVKLGLIAVSEGLLNQKQADEVNRLQASMDKRFGDIAIEKGYLSEGQLKHLLLQQGNPYLQFLQALTESEYLTLDETELLLAEYQSENGLTATDINAIKSGDIDLITPVFVHIEAPYCTRLIQLALRNIIRFISSDIYFEEAYAVEKTTFDNIAFQQLNGNFNVLTGFAADGDALLSIANPFAKEEFDTVDTDAFDSVCEFVNCVNGLFASILSQEGTDLELFPPVFYKKATLNPDGKIYVVPVIINGAKVHLLVSVDTAIEIQ